MGRRNIPKGRSALAALLAWALALLLLAGTPPVSAQQDPAQLERARNEESALEMWPEAGDPQSIMGREIQRLLDQYSAQRDPRLSAVTAPMWIASQAAANTERLRNERDSQQSAMRLYPDLAVLDSPLNKLFRETYTRYKEVRPEYFNDPRWPIKLAQQTARQLNAQRAIGSLPSKPSPAGLGEPGSTAEAQPADVAPHPARRWIVNSVLVLAAIALAIAIVRRALHQQRLVSTGEQDGSSI